MALNHHDEVARSRTVDRFSDTVRVLARREPVDRREAAVGHARTRRPTASRPRRAGSPGPPRDRAAPQRPRWSPRQACRDPRVRRHAAARAARRLLRWSLLVLADRRRRRPGRGRIFGWVWDAIPAGMLVAWLVACRLMVKPRARRAPARAAGPAEAPAAATRRAEDRLRPPRRPGEALETARPLVDRLAVGPAAGHAADVRQQAAAPAARSARSTWLHRRQDLAAAPRPTARWPASRGRAAEVRAATTGRRSAAVGSRPVDSDRPRPGGIFSPRVSVRRTRWGCGAVGSASRSQ